MYIMKNNEFITINNRPGTHLSRPQQAETLPMVLQSSSVMSFRSSRKCSPIKYESNMNGSWISWLTITEDMNCVKCNTTWLLTSREAAAGFIIDFLLRGKAIVFLEFLPCCYCLERVRKKNNVLTIKDLRALTDTWTALLKDTYGLG